MIWFGMGPAAATWYAMLRELEQFVRHGPRVDRSNPEHELPDADLADGERLAAVRREAARRLFGSHR